MKLLTVPTLSDEMSGWDDIDWGEVINTGIKTTGQVIASTKTPISQPAMNPNYPIYPGSYTGSGIYPSSSIGGISPIVLLGGLAIGAYLLLRK